MNAQLTDRTDAFETGNSLSRALSDIGAKALTRRSMLDRILRREAIERWENEGGDLLADGTSEVSVSGCAKR